MKITNLQDLGQKIKTTRKDLGISQTGLALAAGMGIRSIVEMENGTRNTGMYNVIKVCSLLGLDIEIN